MRTERQLKRRSLLRWLGGTGAALVVGSGRQARAAQLKIRVGYPTALHGEVAKVLAKTPIASQHGLDIEASFFQYGPPQIEGLVSKSLDVAFTSVVPTATLVAKQPGAVTVIAALGASGHGLVVPADSPIHSLAEFKGKKIAVAFGTDAQLDLLAALKGAGLDPTKEVEILNVPPDAQPAALEQKQAEGVVLRQPQLLKFTGKGAREIRRWPHHLWVIARTEFLTANPTARAALVAAIRDAALFVVEHPQQSAEWFAQDLRLDPALVRTISAENPLYAAGKQLSVQVSPEFRAFASSRAQELVDFGLSKAPAQFLY